MNQQTSVLCPDPRHDPIDVDLLEDIAVAAQVAYTRLEGAGVAVEVVANLGEKLEARDRWKSTTNHPRRMEGGSAA
jgi:hypothetical protein